MLMPVPGVRVGHYTDAVGATGCTVVELPPGSIASFEVRGGAAACRELLPLEPDKSVTSEQHHREHGAGLRCGDDHRRVHAHLLRRPGRHARLSDRRAAVAFDRRRRGWLIYATGPSELGVHPTSNEHEGVVHTSPRHHEIALVCDDIAATVTELTGRGARFTREIRDEGWRRRPRCRVRIRS